MNMKITMSLAYFHSFSLFSFANIYHLLSLRILINKKAKCKNHTSLPNAHLAINVLQHIPSMFPFSLEDVQMTQITAPEWGSMYWMEYMGLICYSKILVMTNRLTELTYLALNWGSFLLMFLEVLLFLLLL